MAASSRGAAVDGIHPLKYSWDVWVSHRSVSAAPAPVKHSHGKKEDAKAIGTPGKEKESREDWEGGVVRLGGFSSVSRADCLFFAPFSLQRCR